MQALSPAQVAAILSELPALRVGVVGDLCLDVYLRVEPEASEVSVETGLATQPVARQRYSLGGAGNVAANLRVMGIGTVRAFGLTGRDPYGGELRRLLHAAGVLSEGLGTQTEGWQTHAYTKVYVGEQEQPRLDYGNFNTLAPDTAAALLADVEARLPELDVLIINQQVTRGIHTQEFRRELQARLARHPSVLSIVDSRAYSAEFPLSLHKLNGREAAALCGVPAGQGPFPAEQASRLADTLYERWGRPLFLTRGENGCLVRDADGCHEVPGLLLLGRTDPVGAGDSLLAGVAAALAAGRTPAEAAAFGNLVAGVTVQKLQQTGTASPEEILALVREANYRHHPELAALPQRARYHGGTRIEIVERLPDRPPRQAIFDHDGTVSTLRQGWEEVMEPVMVRAILGERWRQADEAAHAAVLSRVREYIDRTTGVQTLVQMQGLVEMVREFGHVPAGQILDAPGYKALYNEELMRQVGLRLGRLERAELAAEDFTVKGAPGFLAQLHRRGVRLYLASGTDQADVEREAALLGYACLFEGRIYGAIGDLRHEPKRKVLEKILREIGPKEAQGLVTFGDGPVEIQETRRSGGLAVGVASDEVHRRGLNAAKRSRLIQAGADLIIPDFSQGRELLTLLFADAER
jgi:bifunctional ADP-heptose synthase (sugar kinase/adenylyltransferase)/phosphoglycolate phosphatase-like HAD superfamily hydrolase